MSQAEPTRRLDDVGLIPYGSGLRRGLDARELGVRGFQLETLAASGVAVPTGLTVPVPNVPALARLDRAAAAVRWLEASVKSRIGNTSGALLRLGASSPIEVTGLPADLITIGLDPFDPEAALADPAYDQAFDSWCKTAALIAELVLDVPGDSLADLIFDVPDPRERAKAICRLCEDVGKAPMPLTAEGQLAHAARVIIVRWASPRAKRARLSQRVPADLLLALHVDAEWVRQDAGSLYGTAISRDAETGDFAPTGWVRDGIRGYDGAASRPMSSLATSDELSSVLAELEARLASSVEVDFAATHDRMVLVGVREVRPSPRAAVALAVDLGTRGIRLEAEAVASVLPDDVVSLLHPRVRLSGSELLLLEGLPAAPGAAVGHLVVTSDAAVAYAESGRRSILMMKETSPADLAGMTAASGIVTAAGGLASHAAVVARGMGTPAVCGASALTVDVAKGTVTVGAQTVSVGDLISVDGDTGRVYSGEVDVVVPRTSPSLNTLLTWADDQRRLGIRANADNGPDTRTAVEFGAEGIGLCRTEHQFLGDRLPLVRRFILAADNASEADALKALTRAQEEDFTDLFLAAGDRPVTVRLLDAPMHEFLPHRLEDAESKAEFAVAQSYHESNPMLGLRGVRLAMLRDGLYPAQVEAVFHAWIAAAKDDRRPLLEIMVPLVSIPEELGATAQMIRQVHRDVTAETGINIPFKIGAMVETPRAALMAGQLARWAEFLSFGTNDLTQLTYGFSRDDVEGRMLGRYVERGLVDASPFARLDPDGVGALMRMAVQSARAVRPDMKLGICGEHGGDPESIALCEELGLDYVSCSPHRVPIARLAAAHARQLEGSAT
jgi:pyruvate,orthophosphate dikinase